MIEMIEMIDDAAGKLWKFLDENGPSSVTKIATETGINKNDNVSERPFISNISLSSLESWMRQKENDAEYKQEMVIARKHVRGAQPHVAQVATLDNRQLFRFRHAVTERLPDDEHGC